MKYAIEKNERYTLVHLHEPRLDATVSPQFKSELVTLHAAGSPNIILDLSQVKLIDSYGLSALLVGMRLCRDAGGAFILVGLNDYVRNIIHISQLTTAFESLPTVPEAIDAVFMHELGRELRGDA